MEMFRFSNDPQTITLMSRCWKKKETGADFFIKVDRDVLDSLPSEKSVKMTLGKVSGPTWKIPSILYLF